ncbi:MAG: phosphate ABC transporter permease subunit PstC [Verrucomicrobiota bacterium]
MMQRTQLQLKRQRGQGILGLSRHLLLKAFFGGNAILAIVVLLLITFFLFREGLSFFPQYREDLESYSKSGMEYVSLIKEEQGRFKELTNSLVAIQSARIEQLQAEGLSQTEIRSKTAPMQEYLYDFMDLAIPLRNYQVQVQAIAAATYMDSQAAQTQAENAFDEGQFTETVALLRDSVPDFLNTQRELAQGIRKRMAEVPYADDPALRDQVAKFKQSADTFLDNIPRAEAQIKAWEPSAKVSFFDAIKAFVLGRDWVINNDGHSLYGLLPLFTGSLLVTGIAIVIALPFGVGAAIYTNQMATRRESSMIKPFIEFITAIPSVVIGFFGIAVLGTTLRWLSQLPLLSWWPGFPIVERLNAFTAGCLLALMAIPTIFTLSEDALNRVPRIYKESSFALGATRFQTTMRIIVPSAVSGIISAVLLGIGRVIGETMVVVLCAGNRIRIPDFSQGMGVPFEPVHTMTGIIAQEMGEVAQGGVHYRALFCVGIVLFLLTLVINMVAQKIFRHTRVGE